MQPIPDDFGWCTVQLLGASDPFIEPLRKDFMEKQLHLFWIHAFPDTGCDLSDFRLVFIIRRTDFQKVNRISAINGLFNEYIDLIIHALL
jgi:hypothetical protein